MTTVNELSSAKNRFKAGQTTQLTVYRMGEEVTLTITFDEQDSTAQSSGGSQTQDPAPMPTSNGSYYGGQYPYGGYDNGDEFFNNFPWSYFFGR